MTREKRKIAVEEFKEWRDSYYNKNKLPATMFIEEVIKILEQEPSGETVSLEAFKQVKWERDIAIEQLKELGYGFGQKIESSGDAISRQAVYEQINCWIGSGEYRYTNATHYLTERVKHISPVKSQEPMTGYWIRISPAEIYECSECGQNVMTSDICAYKFCHGCSARMVEPQEREDKA